MRHTSADKLSSGSADGLRSLRYSTNKIPPPLEKFYLLIFYHHCLLFFFTIFKLTHFFVKFYLMLSIFTCILRQVRFIADISENCQHRRWCTFCIDNAKFRPILATSGYFSANLHTCTTFRLSAGKNFFSSFFSSFSSFSFSFSSHMRPEASFS